MKRKLLLLLCACMLMGGCSSTSKLGDVSDPSSKTQNVAAGEYKLGAPSNRQITPVTLEDEYQKAAFLLDQVYAENGENTLVSPLSLNVALGLVAEGASGKTARELYQYLGREDYADWVNEYMTYAEGLKSEGSEFSKYTFQYKLANSIWIKEGETLNKDYKKLVQNKFRAEAENVDFVGKADETAKKINSWCDKHTEGLIKEVVNAKMFTSDLMAVLVNSVYFESPWSENWNVGDHEFTNLKGEKTTQEMLFDTVDTYYENQYCTAFSKNYYNGFQFIGILPKQEGDFQLSDLDLKSLLESKTYDYDVKAIAPKLDFDCTAKNIIDILKAEGVTLPFDGNQAEFERLIDGQSLYISAILQKCKIELDEEGTRAAAVTAIFMDKATAVAPEIRETKEVYLDRPFAFLIYDSENDQIVFAGKVTNVQ